jgi:predicted nuclease of predicted toxin-antitoxin system
MRFLLDVCVSSRSLQAFLVDQGHDVLPAFAIDPKASDERLMAMALQDERVFVTEDKDFGELIFVRRLPHDPIVRLVELTVEEQIKGMAELLEGFASEMTGQVIITITRGRIRMRR